MIAVEPASSAVLSGKPAGSHMIQGIGAGFVPHVLDRSVIDEIIPVTDAQAFHMTRLLLRKEGIIAGISSGAALHAAIEVSKRTENKAGSTNNRGRACIISRTFRETGWVAHDPGHWRRIYPAGA